MWCLAKLVLGQQQLPFQALTVSTPDINNDGYDDILFAGLGFAGVFFGKATWTATQAVSAYSGSNGFTFTGGWSGYAGNSRKGDINGDGIDDIFTAHFCMPYVNVVFGSSAAWPASINTSSLNGTNGFVITSSNPVGSCSVRPAIGDINNDGFSDFVIGHQSHTTSGNNLVFGIYGKANGWVANDVFDTRVTQPY